MSHISLKKLFFVLTVFSSFLLQAQRTAWQQRVTYKMDVEMDAKTHRYKGNQKISYTNNSPDKLRKVFFHLYFNAFQPGSMMDVRSRSLPDPDSRVGDRISFLKEDEIGKMDVVSLRMNGKRVEFTQEGTVLEASLSEEIKPNTTVEFDLEFNAQVPIQIRRSGRDNKEGISYSMSQWYPKICEYDKHGWHANPYIGREFHGVWGSYDVSISMAKDYTIAGTGVLQNPDQVGHGYQQKGVRSQNNEILKWHFIAENVHDFVWAADTDYIHDIITTERGVDLHFFYQEEANKDNVWKDFQPYMSKAFDFAEKKYGDYPYDQYSFIQGGDGGMEYPMATLITGNRNLNSLVGVGVHEAMHSWYQGMLATNESLYPWMDEGFTSYASNEIEKYLFPERYKGDPHMYAYNSYFKVVESGTEEVASTHADHYNTNRAYGMTSYSKGEIFLNQLNYIVGQRTLDECLLKYHQEFAFRHPDPVDFKRIVELASGMELDWYFNYWINTTHTIDYGIESVAKEGKRTKVTLVREGKMMMPVELDVTLIDGTVSKYYIPLRMMRADKRFRGQVRTLTDWAWVNRSYELDIPVPIDKIKSIQINSEAKVADVFQGNDKLEIPEKFSWNKSVLKLIKTKKNKIKLKAIKKS